MLAYLYVPGDLFERVLGGAAAALAPGGRVVVVGHHGDNLESGVGWPQAPAVLYAAEDVVGALPGPWVDRAARVERQLETPAGARRTLNALVFAGGLEPLLPRGGVAS